jgi:hypothetical protein
MVFFLSKCLIFNSRFLQSGFVVHRSFNQENHCYANQENFFHVGSNYYLFVLDILYISLLVLRLGALPSGDKPDNPEILPLCVMTLHI